MPVGDATERRLVIVWTSADREVALNMVFMYARNCLLKDWWDRVVLMVWGPAARLILEDAEVRAALDEARAAGVMVWACRACAERYGIVNRLQDLGLDVLYVGQPLTRMLQTDWKTLSF
ncbi:MAG: DsrE family protein [Thermodesulfobacteriota bacterium]